MEHQANYVVGHKDGKVYLQDMGVKGVVDGKEVQILAPRYVAWTADQARQVAAMLLASADAVDGVVDEG